MDQIEIINREHWLTELVKRLQPMLKELGHPMPKWRISMSFPVTSARPRRNGGQRLGECWGAEASADGTREILISPVRDDAVEIAETVIHEMCHNVLPPQTGHKAPFARLAKAVGLEGKPTSTNAGPDLKAKLEKIVAELGPYPHAKLDATGRKKQGTRLLPSQCPTCGYLVRVTWKWIDVAGHPICPSCYTPLESPDEGEGESLLEISEQAVEYRLKNDKGERFRIRMLKTGKNTRWTVMDYGSNIGYFAKGNPRIFPADNRQEAVDLAEAIKEGLLTPEQLDDRIDEEVEPDIDILSEESEDEEHSDFDGDLTDEELEEYNANETTRNAWVTKPEEA